MWDQKLFELFTTIIPQGFAFVLLFFSLTNIRIEKKSYILFSMIFAVLTFFIRPYVNFGVHSVIMLFVLVLIAVKWGKVSIFTSVIYGVILFIVAFLCEFLTFFVLNMFKFNIDLLNTDPQIRAVIGFIPLCMLFAIGLIVYYTKMKAKNKEDKIDVI